MSCFVFKERHKVELYDVRLLVECEFVAHSDSRVTVSVQKVFASLQGRADGPDISSLFAASDKLLNELNEILLNRHRSE
jgi:hypothetical protein